MTSSSAAVLAWRIGYVGVLTLCVMMISWIWFAPGSCSPISNAMDDARFRRASDALVPANLVLKYRNHLAVCLAHVLPASAWCAIAPFQIHPSARRRFPRAHRIAGRVFFALSASMTYGYVLIHRRDLHFHATDFPTIARDELASLWIPYRRLGASFVHVEHAGAMWFAYTAIRAFTAVAFTSTRNFAVHRFAVHRAWTWRHLAAGLGVALQRVFIWVHHLAFDVSRGYGYSRGVPEFQKPIFGDSLVYGGAVAALYAEWCVSLLTHAQSTRPKSA